MARFVPSPKGRAGRYPVQGLVCDQGRRALAVRVARRYPRWLENVTWKRRLAKRIKCALRSLRTKSRQDRG
jgi:hypothetical protein